MNIVMLGTGYVGLVSGACFSEFGFEVTCIDSDISKIKNLKKGIMPIYEPGLESLVKKNFASGKLKFVTLEKKIISNADAIFIAVGTPERRGDGHADLTYVYEAVSQISKYLTNYTVIVTKSTVPVGTSEKIKEIIVSENSKAKFDVVSNPEFLREGSAIEDFMRPNRVIVGCENERSKEVMATIYKPLYLLDTPVLYTNLKTSELIKYASNAFLAIKISFINQMADLSEKINADIKDISRGLGLDKRIGDKFLHPGPGYGGSCFPKDTQALVKIANDNGVSCSLVETVLNYNKERKENLSSIVLRLMGGCLKEKKISILGLSFKPGTDDTRESPSLEIIPRLQALGAKISVFDPVAMNEAKKYLKKINNLKFSMNIEDCLKNSDCLVLLTEWSEFRTISPLKLDLLMKGKVVVDFRNALDDNLFKGSNYKLYQVGRGIVI